jgi:hypothetical protein
MSQHTVDYITEFIECLDYIGSTKYTKCFISHNELSFIYNIGDK